jgi:hypothetical protein
MDKLNPVLQDTPVSTKVAEQVTSWYTTESNSGVYTSSEVAWMHAQGWRTHASSTVGGRTTYFMSRRLLKPESVLNNLVSSYTDAYNEGRQLNDQRYDDLLVLYINSLSINEDEYNALQTDDTAFNTLSTTLIATIESDYDTWSADVDGDLDAWGVDLLAEVNARFDALLASENQKLVDRGLYSGALIVTSTSAVERERQRALNQASDQIAQRQLELKNKIFAEQVSLRSRIFSARDRLRVLLHGFKDKQVSMRALASDALARVVEARTDSYPDLSEVGRLAAALGAGSPEAYAP